MKDTQSLVTQFRSDLFAETGITLDFRRDAFISNNYGNYPQQLSYEDAESIVGFLYSWTHKIIEDNEENYPHFGGYEYNLQMSVEELRTNRLKDIIEGKCHDLFINYTEAYRREGSSLFKYCKESNGYIHCYRDDRLKTMSALILAYENC